MRHRDNFENKEGEPLMLIDLADAGEAMEQQTDVCVVGAGAAGVALARDLMNAGHSVCLLEAGGLDYEEETQNLFIGDNVGMEYYELDHSRLRFFGGTTNIWGGRSVPLDRIDFEPRDWVPHSGWPINLADLEPYYNKAHEALELGEYDYSGDNWHKLQLEPIDFDPGKIITTFWRFDAKEERFNSTQSEDLFKSESVKIVLHANVVHLQAAEDAARVTSITAKSLNGNTAIIRARHYVLACGAIENARLLLISNDVESGGIGNSHDLVGRYFMEHPHGRIAHVKTQDPAALWALYRKRYPVQGPPVAPALAASETLQRDKKILNSACTFKLGRNPDLGLGTSKKIYMNLKHDLSPSRTGRWLWHLYKRLLDWLQRHVSMPLLRAGVKARGFEIYLMARAEQAPNPESRVVLSGQKDALGCRRADLDWQMTDLDKRSIRELGLAMGDELRRLGIGELEICEWIEDGTPDWPVDPTVGNHPIGGYHHMGTTRMSQSPADGVVDANCTVHGYQNLHIAGSSVFTTGGWANPTLTLLALAHRLADHLDSQLKPTQPEA
jgi:choline dehydrogenase-like flavoprotein